MELFDKIRVQAKKNPKKIVLPEGDEPRVVEATSLIIKEGIAKIVLMGKEADVSKNAKKFSLKEGSYEIVDPYKPAALERYVQAYYELRKQKGLTPDAAKATLLDNNVYFAALMVRMGEADGFVAGAGHATKDVARPAIVCIGPEVGVKTVSSFFIMMSGNKKYGENGVFLFADCAIVLSPTSEQLRDIALETANTAKCLCNFKPRVAMLSYSTKGSGMGTSVERVAEAARLVKQQAPELLIDGEMQADAAIEPNVAVIKCPDSPIKGNANVLIFPDLNSGNIAYKLCQRLSAMKAIGPFLQGLAKPASDLSRGCHTSDIIDAVATVAVQAQYSKTQK
ncbi:MAG: phosphate acetyltransferase [Candidatus Omnitrophota bacterium]